MKAIFRSVLVLAIFVALSGPMSIWAQQNHEAGDYSPQFSGAAFKNRVRYLASDELAGRAPGTEGGRRAAAYLAKEFKRIGLEPRAGAKDFFQNIPLVGSTVSPDSARLTVNAEAADGPLVITHDDIAFRTQFIDCATCMLSGEVVFGGYGIDAREYGWNDYGDVSLAGKFVLLLRGLPEAAEALVPGGGYSYYEDDDVKIEQARQRGAAGVIFLTASDQESNFSDTAAAWRQEFVQPDWLRGRPLSVIAWLSPDATARFLDAAGGSLDALSAEAAQATFAVRPLGASLQGSFTQSVRRFSSSNIVGVVPGAAPETGTVVVTAHWDHLGVGAPDEDGDAIYNGAKDNASGVAGLIALAEAAKAAGAQRNIVFVATTAEEADYAQIGARYYVEHPAFPIAETVVNLNFDGVDVIWPARNFMVMPPNGTSAGPTMAALAKPLNKTVTEQPWLPSLNFSFDTAEFMAQGVPGVTLWGGSGFRLENLTVDALRKRYARLGGKIHTPQDEYSKDWSEKAIEEHLELYWAALSYWANGGAALIIDPKGPLAPLLAAGGPPYRALAEKIVERMDLQPGEKVLMLCHPTLFQKIIPHLRYAVMRAGGVNLGCLQDLPQPFPRYWRRDPVLRGFTESRDAMARMARAADAFIALPGTWPNQSAYLGVQDILKSGRGRIVHFHWLGGYSLLREQLPATPRMDRTYAVAVLETDYDALADQQRRFVDAARKGEIRVTTPAGTDVRFRLGKRRPVNIQDGDASAVRALQAKILIDREVELPAGAVRFAPIEDSVEGFIVFTDSYWNDEFVRAPRLTFRQGQVVEVSAAENVAALEAELEGGGEAARRLRGFALGFNPYLAVPEDEPWIPYYGYGAGVVRLSLGENGELGGKIKGDYSRWNFFTDATVEIDGVAWVENGKLVNTPPAQ